jgi:hypothetical protein
MPQTVTVIHRVLATGSSFPSLVETTAGRRYVLKLFGAGPGRRALAAEYVALRLARNAGLNVPDAEVLDLARDFPWHTGTDEFYEAVQRSAGPNLGIAFIENAHDVEAFELGGIPPTFSSRLAAVDALLQNVDRTTSNPNIIRDPSGAHWAIDFGACLLIERLARGAMEPRTELPPNHFLAHAKSAHTLTVADLGIGVPALRDAVEAIPVSWLEDLNLTQRSLLQRLTIYVEALSSI